MNPNVYVKLKNMFTRILIFCLIAFYISCTQTNPREPVTPLPSERQLAWHELEFYAFVHFNMNTFTNMEWGLGSESPEMFNPTELDCGQWAKVCKATRMK
jgi:alpha-L-fucosidase